MSDKYSRSDRPEDDPRAGAPPRTGEARHGGTPQRHANYCETDWAFRILITGGGALSVGLLGLLVYQAVVSQEASTAAKTELLERLAACPAVRDELSEALSDGPLTWP